jgi:CheY-like chemotaxis protein
MTIENFNRTFNDIIKVSNDSNFQIDANTLNLVVAKNLIDKIGATIEFINETGKGTQYIIKLKQKVTSNNILGNIREKIQVMHNNNYHVKNLLGKKMLIVDDKNINLVILERLLVQYNVTIDKCLNPRDSIDLILNNNYDIVFLEDSMDDMSGSEVITRLNSTGNRLPFIVGLVNDGSSLKDSEYNDILYTPIKFKDLNKIINNVFGGDRNDL